MSSVYTFIFPKTFRSQEVIFQKNLCSLSLNFKVNSIVFGILIGGLGAALTNKDKETETRLIKAGIYVVSSLFGGFVAVALQSLKKNIEMKYEKKEELFPTHVFRVAEISKFVFHQGMPYISKEISNKKYISEIFDEEEKEEWFEEAIKEKFSICNNNKEQLIEALHTDIFKQGTCAGEVLHLIELVDQNPKATSEWLLKAIFNEKNWKKACYYHLARNLTINARIPLEKILEERSKCQFSKPKPIGFDFKECAWTKDQQNEYIKQFQELLADYEKDGQIISGYFHINNNLPDKPNHAIYVQFNLHYRFYDPFNGSFYEFPSQKEMLFQLFEHLKVYRHKIEKTDLEFSIQCFSKSLSK